MKTYRGVEVQLHAFFTAALDGGGQLRDLVALSQGKETRMPIE
jgi:hypothetical protein